MPEQPGHSVQADAPPPAQPAVPTAAEPPAGPGSGSRLRSVSKRDPAAVPGKQLLLIVVGLLVVLLVVVLAYWPVADPEPDPDDGRLTWSPPELTDPVTYRVSGDGPGTIEAEEGQDSIVVFDGPVHRRIRMEGGRHWVIQGGEVVNDKEWPNIEDHAGLQFADVTGTAFVEGMLIHGKYGKDGIRVSSGGSEMTLVVQNSRIVDRLAGDDEYHADVIQPFGGIKELKVDRLTGSGDYQGQMWKEEDGTTFGPSDFRRVNYRSVEPEHEYMINFVTSSPTGPVRLWEVYNEPHDRSFCKAQVPSRYAECDEDEDGRKYVTFSEDMSIEVTGRVTEGPPPGGDFVEADDVGMDYVSPGYR